MDLEIILKLENESHSYERYDFVERNKSVSIPYLTLITLLTFSGTFGNFLVLGTLLIINVRQLRYSILAHFDVVLTSHFDKFTLTFSVLRAYLNI